MKIPRLFQTILRWLIALLWVVVAVFPLWYTFSVVFSPPGVPVTQQFFPSSLSAGIEKITAVLTQTNLNIVKASASWRFPP